ncbi:MAG: radical SAM protein [candidate division WOR-3 bacterium]
MSLWVISKRQFDIIRLNKTLNSRVSRRIISTALKKENGKYLFEVIIDKYCNNSLSNSEKIKYFPLIKLLDVVRRSFGTSEEEFKKSLQQITIRKIFANALESLDKYGFKTPQPFADPVMLVWNFTNKCNLLCKHCYQSAIHLREKNKKEELTLSERLEIVEKIGERNIPSLFFSGGEPLIDKDFWEVAKKAKEKGLYLSIATNGTLIDRNMAKKIAELEIGYVQVSIDGASPEKHDKIRGIPGMWERAIKGIKNLIDAGVTTCIAYTHMKENHNEIKGIFKLREELGAYKVVVYNYIPVGRGDFKNDPTPEEREELHKLMYEQLDRGKHIVATTDPTFGAFCRRNESCSLILAHYADLKSKELGAIADVVGGCGAGRAYAAIQPDGRFTPCVYMPDLTIGNLKNQTIEELWNEHPLMKVLKKREDVNCANCSEEEATVCGGCRARAFQYFGDLKAPDPGCIYNKGLLKELSEKLKDKSKVSVEI